MLPYPGSSGASSSTMDQTEGDNSTAAIKFSLTNKRRKVSPPQPEVALAGCASSLSCNGTSGRSIGDRFKKSSVVKVQVNADGQKSDSNTISKRLSSFKSLNMGKNPGGLHRPHRAESMKKSSSLESCDQFEFDGDITESSGVNFQKRSKETCKNPKMSENVKSSLSMESFDEFEFDGDNKDATGNGFHRISKELHKNQHCVSGFAEKDSSIDESDPFEFDGDGVEPSKWGKPNLKNEPLLQCGKKITKGRGSHDRFDLAIELVTSESNNSSEPVNAESQSMSQPLVQEEPTVLEDCLLASVKVIS